jgi:hypothetical protein
VFHGESPRVRLEVRGTTLQRGVRLTRSPSGRERRCSLGTACAPHGTCRAEHRNGEGLRGGQSGAAVRGGIIVARNAAATKPNGVRDVWGNSRGDKRNLIVPRDGAYGREPKWQGHGEKQRYFPCWNVVRGALHDSDHLNVLRTRR